MPKPGSLRHAITYAPRGAFLHWLIRQSGLKVLALFVLFYCWIGVIFAAVYFLMLKPFAQVEAYAPWPQAVEDCLHFSFVTQATVGYGDLTPLGGARLLCGLQAVTGLVLNALGLGILLLKVTNRPPRWKFAAHLSYDPKLHQLVAWVWNQDARTFFDATATLIVARALPQGGTARIRRTKIELQAGPPSIWRPGRTSLVRTISALPDAQILARTGKPNVIGPLTLEPNDRIYVVYSGSSDDSGAIVWKEYVYSLADIRCGRRHNVLPVGKLDTAWRECDYDNFGRVFPTPDEDCRACELHNRCTLDVATRIRLTVSAQTAKPEAPQQPSTTPRVEA